MNTELILGANGGGMVELTLPTTFEDYSEDQIGIVKVSGTTYTLYRRIIYVNGVTSGQRMVTGNLSSRMHRIMSLGGILSDGTFNYPMEHTHYSTPTTAQLNIYYNKSTDKFVIGAGTNYTNTLTGYIIVTYY